MKKWIPYGYYCYGRMKKLEGGGFSAVQCRNYVYSHTIDDAIICPVALGSKEFNSTAGSLLVIL